MQAFFFFFNCTVSAVFPLLRAYLVIYLTFFELSKEFLILCVCSVCFVLSPHLCYFTFKVQWPNTELFCLWSHYTVWIISSHLYLHLTFSCIYRNFICLYELLLGALTEGFQLAKLSFSHTFLDRCFVSSALWKCIAFH